MTKKVEVMNVEDMLVKSERLERNVDQIRRIAREILNMRKISDTDLTIIGIPLINGKNLFFPHEEQASEFARLKSGR